MSGNGMPPKGFVQVAEKNKNLLDPTRRIEKTEFFVLIVNYWMGLKEWMVIKNIDFNQVLIPLGSNRKEEEEVEEEEEDVLNLPHLTILE